MLTSKASDALFLIILLLQVMSQITISEVQGKQKQVDGWIEEMGLVWDDLKKPSSSERMFCLMS